MTHWGWYWKVRKNHIPRKLCSSLPSIDSFQLHAKNRMIGFRVDPLDIKAKLVGDNLRITYRNRGEYSYLIPIDKQKCHFGGFRYFFKCPLCHKRMRMLYLAEHSLFLCRNCLNLSYYSQRLRSSKRYAYMEDKIKNYIKAKGGNMDEYRKPPRMHQKTYQALKDKKFDYESKAFDAMHKEVYEWYGY